MIDTRTVSRVVIATLTYYVAVTTLLSLSRARHGSRGQSHERLRPYGFWGADDDHVFLSSDRSHGSRRRTASSAAAEQGVVARVTWLAVGAVIGTALFPLMTPSGGGGLAQRISFAVAFAWMIVVALEMPKIAAVASPIPNQAARA